MTVEFTGNRLLAPSFGNSLYTWTALIGVILLALSCGDYLGGWLVDRVPRVSLLPVLFSLGGVLTTAIPLLARLLPEQSTMDLIWGPVVISLALFFLPGLVLASITPVSIRLLSKTLADASIGKSAGTVGMASALGSFAGTIATSYVLLPVFGAVSYTHLDVYKRQRRRCGPCRSTKGCRGFSWWPCARRGLSRPRES